MTSTHTTTPAPPTTRPRARAVRFEAVTTWEALTPPAAPRLAPGACLPAT